MHFKIPCILYPFTIQFYFGDDPIEFFRGKKITIKEEDLEDCDGLTKYYHSGGIAVILPKVPETSYEHSVLIHELFHVTHYILDKVGMVLSDDSEEAYAYLIGYLTQKVYEKLNR